MLDDLMNYFSGTSGIYGTSPGISYDSESFAWGLPEDYNGQGLRLKQRPTEGLFVPPADINAASVESLAKGGSNIPAQLGSNEPNKNPTDKNKMLQIGLLGAGLMNQGQPQRQSPQLPREAWGAQSQSGSFAQMAPFAQGVQLHQSQAIKDALRRKMQEASQGLLG